MVTISNRDNHTLETKSNIAFVWLCNYNRERKARIRRGDFVIKKLYRYRIIRKAIEKTMLQFSNSTPHISKYCFYGAVDIGPEYLVVWYLFEKDIELEAAKNNGLCIELYETTIHNLIEFGYPQKAFCENEVELSPNITFSNSTDDNTMNNIIYSLSHRKAKIAFSTEEDIDKKANGDYHLYFQ